MCQTWPLANGFTRSLFFWFGVFIGMCLKTFCEAGASSVRDNPLRGPVHPVSRRLDSAPGFFRLMPGKNLTLRLTRLYPCIRP
jgi:hypothetical protein